MQCKKLFEFRSGIFALLLVAITACGGGGGGTADTAAPVQPDLLSVTSRLPDTGITASQCYAAGSNVLVSCTSAAAIALNSQQDGMRGRDVSNNDNTDGKAGFSYTKIGANGETLPASATAWSCVKDNITGLVWEIKTADGGLRDKDKTYTHYDSTTSPQIGKTFFQKDLNTAPTQAQIDAASNSIGFKNAVNTAGLCGAADWRLPTADELQGIVDYGVQVPEPNIVPTIVPTIDATWFPNTQHFPFWTSQPYLGDSGFGWYVNFFNGGLTLFFRSSTYRVRLVRAGQ